MAQVKLTIQHNGVLYEPPIKDEVQLEWERTGAPGKLTFTVIKVDGLSFSEGDPVLLYYDNKKVFAGYVFKKKRDKEHHIEVTCYDQLRYLKNKYSYVFEKKSATQIIKSLCKDFNLNMGTLDNTKYVIPSVVEENITAMDIIMSVLEETLLNTSNMFILYDNFGEITLKNANDMMSTTLIFEDSAENFDYTSSIDDETYTNIVLYYKNEDNSMKVFNAYSPSKTSEWGMLRYFEEVKNPSIGKNKANNLLNLYCRKTRELKVTGAFGDIAVRGGTLIPVKLNLGDVSTNNYMIVEKVTHIFTDSQHTMDLTLEGAWEKDNYTVSYNEYGEVKESSKTTSVTSNVNYTPRLTEPSTSDKNYIQYGRGGYNYCIQIRNGSCLPNCVGYAWGRWRELLGKKHNLSTKNAESWWGNTSDGYKRGQTPQLGAVMCWRKGQAGNTYDGAGHVAIVEKINSDGSITCSNSDYSGRRFYTRTMKSPYSLGKSYTFQGFIYLPVSSSTTNGSISTATKTSGNAKADYIVKTLVANGMTTAGACGVLANIEAESNFNTGALGDGGTSYGICQWHNQRWTNLRSYCSRNGYSSSSIEGQTAFLIHELKNAYPSVWSIGRSATGLQGARDTAYTMCVVFEVPANKYVKGRQRSSKADKWWYIYGG